MMIPLYLLVFIASILFTAANGVVFKFAQPPPGTDTMYCLTIDCTTIEGMRTHSHTSHHGRLHYVEGDSVYAELEAYNCPFRKYDLSIRIMQKARPRMIHAAASGNVKWLTGVELNNDLVYELDYVAGKLREIVPKVATKVKTEPGIKNSKPEPEQEPESSENKSESDDDEEDESESDPEASDSESDPEASDSESDPEANKSESDPEANKSETDPEANKSESDPEANESDTVPCGNESESGSESETGSEPEEKTATENAKKRRKAIFERKNFALKKRKLGDEKYSKVVGERIEKLKKQHHQIAEEQKQIKQGQAELRAKLEHVTHECQTLRRETDKLFAQSAKNGQKLGLCFAILRLRNEGKVDTEEYRKLVEQLEEMRGNGGEGDQ